MKVRKVIGKSLEKSLNDAEWRMKHYWPKVLDGTYLRQEKKKVKSA